MVTPRPVSVIPTQAAQSAAASAASIAAGWGTSSNGYDPDRFYTAAKTSATASPPGAYEHLRIKVPPFIYQQLRDLVESNDVPAYDSPDDVIRDGLYHRLHYLASTRGTPDFKRKVRSFCEQVEHEQAVHSAEIQWNKLADLLERSKVMFEKYAADEGWKTLHTMIETHRQYTDAWDDCKMKERLLALCDEYERKIPANILF